MKILVRADASEFLGIGHVMRQLTLADAATQNGAQIEFVLREHPGHLAELIQRRGFRCHILPVLKPGILGASWGQDARDTADLARQAQSDWVFVDHYGLDARWEREQNTRVLVMDDMFDRPHDCDVLVNQNLGVTAAHYEGLIPSRTTCLMGSDYALLRPEFAQLRSRALARRGNPVLREILITMGGSDQPNATGWVLGLLAKSVLPKDVHLTIVMGPSAQNLADVRAQAAALSCQTTVLEGSSDMAGLMVRADLSIGAAGSTSWERCALGLPSIMIILAENQRVIGQALDQAHAAITIEFGQQTAFKSAFEALAFRADLRKIMAEAAGKVVDGVGANRMAKTLCMF